MSAFIAALLGGTLYSDRATCGKSLRLSIWTHIGLFFRFVRTGGDVNMSDENGNEMPPPMGESAPMPAPMPAPAKRRKAKRKKKAAAAPPARKKSAAKKKKGGRKAAKAGAKKKAAPKAAKRGAKRKKAGKKKKGRR
jgi:hypothetical protein